MSTNVPDVSAERAALVVGFLNTLDVESGTDVLDGARAYAGWCRVHRVRPSAVADARRLRDALRANVDGRRTRLAPVAIDVTIDPAGGLRPTTRELVPAVVAAALALTVTGDFGRIKLCPADDCREAFYDRSRNRSRVWCDMTDCGNVAKVRALRARRH